MDTAFRPDGWMRIAARSPAAAPSAHSSSVERRSEHRRNGCGGTIIEYQDESWILMTDRAPTEAGASRRALRFWIETGFKALKRSPSARRAPPKAAPERVSYGIGCAEPPSDQGQDMARRLAAARTVSASAGRREGRLSPRIPKSTPISPSSEKARMRARNAQARLRRRDARAPGETKPCPRNSPANH